MQQVDPCLNHFQTEIDHLTVPDSFTFPFYYTPHPLAQIAIKEVQEELKTKDLGHNFGLNEKSDLPPIGKMIGVLIVKTVEGKIAYLKAVSGALQKVKTPQGYVPFIFDHKEQERISQIAQDQVEVLNKKIQEIEDDKEYKRLQTRWIENEKRLDSELENFREEMRRAKKERSLKRKDPALTNEDIKTLAQESIFYKSKLTKLKEKIQEEKTRLKESLDQIEKLKNDSIQERKEILINLQEQRLLAYSFLDSNKNERHLKSIFDEYANYSAPAGTGDCAAPKLLQYAYKMNYTPLAMAEFWWGAPHKLEIRKHKYIYPSCSSRCRPLLKHMLSGLEVDEDPVNKEPSEKFTIEKLYEDDDLLVVNKPSGLLSVPGAIVKTSLLNLMAKEYPESKDCLIVHRLDQETSGIVLLAKNKETNKELQKQFINKTIQKKYIALLDGHIKEDEGVIELPLMLDFHNRPRQMVSFKDGKPAKTKFKVLERREKQTLIEFTPITGRTHQLRVHSAHHMGLNAPIIGDTIYGIKDKRLCLHAKEIIFKHPRTGNEVFIECGVWF